MMSKLFLPNMLKRSKRSGIIDISSVASYLPGVQFMGIYAGSKVFNRVLTDGYVQEIGFSKIDFQCLMPGWVTTPLTR